MQDNNSEETTLEGKLAQQLRASEQQLDEEALSSLAHVRKQALSTPRRTGRVWQGGLLAASVAVIALLVSVPEQEAAMDTVPLQEVMAMEEGLDIELYENLEFYEWLAAQEDLG